MNEIKNLLHKELNASKNHEMFWNEIMTFAAEQLNTYFETVNKTGLNFLIQQNEDRETLKEKLEKDIEVVRNNLAMLAKFNHYISSLNKANLEKDKEIEMLNKEVENATNYLDIKEKELEKTKTKIEHDLSKKLEHARTQINAIIELSNQAACADVDTIKKLPEKVSLSASDVARVLKDNKLWPEEEKLTQIKPKKDREGEHGANGVTHKGSKNSTKQKDCESNSEQLSFDNSDPKNKEEN